MSRRLPLASCVLCCVSARPRSRGGASIIVSVLRARADEAPKKHPDGGLERLPAVHPGGDDVSTPSPPLASLCVRRSRPGSLPPHSASGLRFYHEKAEKWSACPPLPP